MSTVLTCENAGDRAACEALLSARACSSQRPTNSGVMYVPGGEVGQRAAAVVLVLDAHRSGGRRRQRRVTAAARLDRGLLVGADDVVARRSTACRPRRGRRGRAHDRPCPRSRGHGGRSSRAPSTGGWRSRTATARCGAADVSDEPAGDRLAAQVRHGSRDSGTPSWEGSSQASALTAITTSGGKDRRPAGAGTFSQARQPLFEEALAPLRHDLAAGVQPRSDLVVAQPLSSQQHDLGRTTS
jgi:hypothetical protein